MNFSRKLFSEFLILNLLHYLLLFVWRTKAPALTGTVFSVVRITEKLGQ